MRRALDSFCDFVVLRMAPPQEDLENDFCDFDTWFAPNLVLAMRRVADRKCLPYGSMVPGILYTVCALSDRP